MPTIPHHSDLIESQVATAVAKKITRLRKGFSPRVLDLFSGCGGISLGFQAAGFEISAALEVDEHAAASHALNFHGGNEAHAVARDITRTSASQLSAELSLGRVDMAFDVIVGGPPCQAFARVGRSKLREIAEHPEAFRHDPRSRLYIEYLNYVDDCAPLAVVIENVPDMLNHGGHNIAEEICDVLSAKGYMCGYSLLNAAFFGVPQMRERMFLLAVRSELVDEIRFPSATHYIELPSGYEGSRAVALKLLNNEQSTAENHFYRAGAAASPDLPRAVTAREAIGDLPAIDARSLLRLGSLRRGARRFDQPLPYRHSEALSNFAIAMRSWPGHEGSPQLVDHVIRFLPRDYDLFARLQPGDQYPEAHKEACRMFEEALARAEKMSGSKIMQGVGEWERLRASIVPPYDPSKFPNKWRKMEPDMPCRTLMAHLGKDSYSHIHFDSSQARTISVREAARLQSFPDGFKFVGTMNPAFRQIGNAVPPLLAKAIAMSLKKQLSEAIVGSSLKTKAGAKAA